jgi:hypothetical protein
MSQICHKGAEENDDEHVKQYADAISCAFTFDWRTGAQIE